MHVYRRSGAPRLHGVVKSLLQDVLMLPKDNGPGHASFVSRRDIMIGGALTGLVFANWPNT